MTLADTEKLLKSLKYGQVPSKYKSHDEVAKILTNFLAENWEQNHIEILSILKKLYDTEKYLDMELLFFDYTRFRLNRHLRRLKTGFLEEVAIESYRFNHFEFHDSVLINMKQNTKNIELSIDLIETWEEDINHKKGFNKLVENISSHLLMLQLI